MDFPISYDPAAASDMPGIMPGADLSSLLGPLAGLSEMGFGLYDILNGQLGPGIGTLLAGPLGGILGGILQGEFSGVPKGAKTGGAASMLEREGGVAGELGKGISDLGGGKGSSVLSNPAFAHETNTLADALTWLSGKNLPGWKAKGSTGEIANIQPPHGAPYSKPVNIMGVESADQLGAQLGPSPNLTPEQIAKILPQLEAMAKTPGMTVEGMKKAITPMLSPGSLGDYMNQGKGQLDIPTQPGGPGPSPGESTRQPTQPGASPLWPLLIGGGGGALLASLLSGGGGDGGDTANPNQSASNGGLAYPLVAGFGTRINPGVAPRFGAPIQF